MPQAENEQDQNGDDALRRFIDRLEQWPEDDPPTSADLRALRREIRLTVEQRDKLEILAENHIRRARSALAGRSYDLAAAELARASQLRPLDPQPRVELAGIYLQRSLERDYGRPDRRKALRLARKALELSPGDEHARRFLKDYRRMNADFRSVRIRRYALPAALLLLLLGAAGWWQREWVVGLLRPPLTVTSDGTGALAGTTPPERREVPAAPAGLSGGALDMEILSSSVGRRNDASFLDVRGRLRLSQGSLGALTLLIRGRDESGNAVFTIPWTVRDEAAPRLYPGDSQSLTAFRWLESTEENVRSIEISVRNMELSDAAAAPDFGEPEVYWDADRPDGADLEVQLRRWEIIEAFDRQVVRMDLAVGNSGLGDYSRLAFDISLGPDLPVRPVQAVSPSDVPMERGERRVLSVAVGVPLDADLAGRTATIRVREAGRMTSQEL